MSIHSKSLYRSILDEINSQKESLILVQLKDLIDRGLLVVEESTPVIIREVGYENSYQLRQAIKLTLKDKEYIEKLEKENAELKSTLDAIKKAVQTIL